MKRILKREYTAEFREQAVAMVNNGRSVPEVAGDLVRSGTADIGLDRGSSLGKKPLPRMCVQHKGTGRNMIASVASAKTRIRRRR